MRPLDVNELLRKADDEGIGDEVRKPVFLDGAARQRLLSRRGVSARVSKGGGERAVRGGREREAAQGAGRPEEARRRRGQFSFEWAADEDTAEAAASGAEARRLLGTRRRAAVEESYMRRHWSELAREEMTARDWRIMREDYNISTKGGGVRAPLRDWGESGEMPAELVRIVQERLGFGEPTPIQRVTIPNALHGRDYVGVAATGSGKTLAFLLPIFAKLGRLAPLNAVTRQDGPRALVLAPTRELAQQIEAQARQFLSHWQRPCPVASIVGGHSFEEIALSLQGGCEVLVATPGRLLDCLEHHMLVLRQVATLVLDEADRMVDMGFEEQLTDVLARIDVLAERQVLMFTATMTHTIEKIANGYLKNAVYATVGGADAEPQIRQLVEYVPAEEQRFTKLTREVLPNFAPPIIIFINYKATANWLSEKFERETRFRTTVLHGSRSQEQREHSLRQLRSGKVDIMIATNVAGRGIDIPNVSLVVNFQMPFQLEDYVHRIGRTGRAGQSGTALTFLTDKDENALVETLYEYVTKNNITGKNYISADVKKQFSLGRNSFKALLD
ncbi:AFR452Cp [Eremothecium gossypii ATCC 10895]|uniref:RNA helicase n=1 Tax=Eremothecium gossypii (strain ATCC 10895 / CBS 109.51 / FGSC 9923 / NRRL Y-1056) TaxID=284811 RepID=Q752X1_EREGS|nr:AFR452Cp [Eremothecium gossypii ATCC 10895]AAS53823.3 AFR452Cp [Eremothecium gossypii ATCC 10895]AEY98135.1 FAFR452Cp [Eremothecium gossypii FDAG1]